MIPAAFADPFSTLARLLFPSWAFFDVHASAPRLEIRQPASDGGTGEWQLAFVAPTRRWWHVVFNPGGTQVLWYQTQIERFCASLANNDDQSAEARAIALAVRDIAAHCVPAHWTRSESPGWQYRVVIAVHDSDGAPSCGSRTTLFESVVVA